MGIFTKIFGSAEKELKKLQPIVDEINSKESVMSKLSDEDIKAKTQEFRKEIESGKSLDDILPEAFAVVREAAKRVIGERHYDVQLLGGIILHQGKIAEMKTGEGKTLTSTLPIYLNSLSKKGVHVVTVNDYLAKRDCNWMGSIFEFLGISTACIVHDAAYLYEANIVDTDEVTVEMENLKLINRKEAYSADITYGTNNEFGFDYLRDNMARSLDQIVQRKHNFVIVDEVDSILIDEARTPLIISAPDTESTKLYQRFASIVPKLKKEVDYQIDEKLKAVTITDEGISKIEGLLGIADLYEPGKIKYVHHLEQALKAQTIFQRDKDYVVKDGEVVIVDDFTGRLMPGRRYSEGLHQAIEAKEGVEVKKESRTMATITFQNYFRMYKKLSGMTGTALTSAEEFFRVYEIDVVEIPTNKPMIRRDLADVVYKSEEGKFNAIVKKIKELNQKGQPVLVGTVAIEKSEALSSKLSRFGVQHEVLNAKNHEKEAQIISQAGEKGAVTIATNMAGRGTDIKLSENVKQLDGLCVIGTERHEARRIDNQLRGRSGRQGDPGTSQFYISLEDELMRRFGGEKLFNIMNTLGLPEDQPIQNKLISRTIENAQSKIEGFNFDIRKHVLEYDDIMNKQREVIYKKRREVLENGDTKNITIEYIQEEIETMVNMFCMEEEDKWQIDKLKEEFSRLINDEDWKTTRIREIKESRNKNIPEKIAEIIEFLFGEAKEAYNKKEKENGENGMREIEKAVILQTIDTMWMRHLDDMDYIRESIGLRGYGQRDPLVEYKREAYNTFTAMLDNVRSNIVQVVFRASLLVPNASSQESMPEKNLNYSGGEAIKQFAGAPQNQSGQDSQEPARNASQSDVDGPIINKNKVGRNEPCPCGSGKKYKKCCGK